YCYFFNPENHVEKEPALSSEDIGDILKRAYEYHEKYAFAKKIKINFVGSGEPLLNCKEISITVSDFSERFPNQQRLKFYTVTNASLITADIAAEMHQLKIFPSVSLDGPQSLHDEHRIFLGGKGTFEATMKGINILRDAGFDLAINTTLNRRLRDNLDEYFDFIEKEGFNKVIFDRLVDTPTGVESVSYEEYYKFLIKVGDIRKLRKLDDLEIGNLEAYRRNFAGIPDQVCTMFGGSCGAGTHFLIYMGKDVYPCGRMFGKSQWLLGDSSEAIDLLQARMYKHVPKRVDCASCSVSEACVKDCLLEYHTEGYSCEPRQVFLKEFSKALQY
ncbi:MAG: radical SAM protein, partial [Lentisphaeraceae bacterium]|nr:radical SAM protein [Lentisphaeraceae bacterium]